MSGSGFPSLKPQFEEREERPSVLILEQRNAKNTGDANTFKLRTFGLEPRALPPRQASRLLAELREQLLVAPLLLLLLLDLPLAAAEQLEPAPGRDALLLELAQQELLLLHQSLTSAAHQSPAVEAAVEPAQSSRESSVPSRGGPGPAGERTGQRSLDDGPLLGLLLGLLLRLDARHELPEVDRGAGLTVEAQLLLLLLLDGLLASLVGLGLLELLAVVLVEPGHELVEAVLVQPGRAPVIARGVVQEAGELLLLRGLQSVVPPVVVIRLVSGEVERLSPEEVHAGRGQVGVGRARRPVVGLGAVLELQEAHLVRALLPLCRIGRLVVVAPPEVGARVLLLVALRRHWLRGEGGRGGAGGSGSGYRRGVAR